MAMFQLYRAPWQFRQTVMALGFAVAVHALGEASASTYQTAEGILDQHNLPKDEIALLSYLDKGLPERDALRFDQRWAVYSSVAATLGELQSGKAIPVLIGLMIAPPPPALESDLLLASVDRTWERWDANYTGNLAQLRAECAMALARIGNEETLEAAQAYEAALRDTILGNLDNSNSGNSLLASYGRVCRAITVMGGKSGIDAMIAFLDHLPTQGPELLVWNLQLCTGQTYGPGYTLPRHRWPEEIGKWQAWWAENRDEFEIDQEFVLNSRKLNLPPPQPDTLREHLAVAHTRFMDFDGDGYGKKSAAWLEKHCKNYQTELAAVIADPNEDAAVRKEALSWYVLAMDTWGNWASGTSALELLTAYAVGDSVYQEENASDTLSQPDRLLMQSEALRLIEKHFPDAAVDVAKRCLPSETIASNAANLIMKSENNLAYMVEHFHEIAPSGRNQVLQMLIHAADSVGRKAFIEGLNSPHVHDVVYASLGIEKLGLESELAPEDRETLERWRVNPEFQLVRLERETSTDSMVPAIHSVLDEVNDASAASAMVYRRSFYLLPERERDVAMTGLTRCVAAYKASRGL